MHNTEKFLNFLLIFRSMNYHSLPLICCVCNQPNIHMCISRRKRMEMMVRGTNFLRRHFLCIKKLEMHSWRGQREDLVFLTRCSAVSPLDVLTTLSAASRPHLSAPSLLQVGAAGRRSLPSFPLRGPQGRPQTSSTHIAEVNPADIRQTDLWPREQTNPGRRRFLKCFSRKWFT